ncbi:hypothetical protein [Flavobacterium sp. RSP29]|uniref:hypothetical protein n=1 Tax=unclassified Flavobacterium TaxID=196869 RepID=UPI003AAFD069
MAQKSAEFTAQNFMISTAALNYDTCPMEGFDSLRIKKNITFTGSFSNKHDFRLWNKRLARCVRGTIQSSF